MLETLQDHLGTRYQLVSRHAGPENFVFLPGGPGADSTYFMALLQHLNLPGHVWLVDFPGNGDNITVDDEYDYDNWQACYLELFNRFEHMHLIGHSFGAMYPLLFSESEQLKSFLVLSSAPCLWLDTAADLAKQYGVDVLMDDIQAFTFDPNQATFDKALMACAPYYFPDSTLAFGKKFLKNLAFAYRPAVWWLNKSDDINYSAQWIPQHVPTLIVGGTRDLITPISLFKQDKRFARDNIKIVEIDGAGHFPWLEEPQAVSKLIQAFYE